MRTVLALLTGAALLTACGSAPPPRETQVEQARTVRVAEVAVRPIAIDLTASGLLVPREEAAVGSELSGYRVQRVLVEEGDRVGRGQVLARLDPALLEGEIARARAQVLQSEATAARARAEAGRVAGLDGRGVLAQEAIEQRRFEARAAEAALAGARAQLRDLVTREARLTLRAPVAGTIIARNLAPGAISVAGGDPLFTIARDNLIELAAEVPEAQLGRIAPGSPAEVTLPSGARIAGQVRTVLPRIGNENQLGTVRIALPVRADLRAGGTATARFGATTRAVPVVPEAAVQFSARGPSVMVVGADNRVRRQAVRPGQRAGGLVELLEGPAVGARVLLSGAAFVLEGDLVRPVPVGKAAAR